MLYPEKFDVVALTNLNGDYASDALAAQVGRIGIAPGANINYETGHAILRATHGTAPDIAGQNKANPVHFSYQGLCSLITVVGQASHLLTKAVEKALFEQKVTKDFASQLEGVAALTTGQFAGRAAS